MTEDDGIAGSIVRLRARAFELRTTDDPAAHDAAEILERAADKAANPPSRPGEAPTPACGGDSE